MIKYRVYDTEDKEYLDSFRTAVTPDGEVFVLSDYKYNDDGQEIWEAKLVCSARQEPGRFIIEQYTGLKDKNGVEIAVGDILRVVSRLADNPKLFFVEMRHEEWNGDVFDLVCYDSNNDNSPIHHVESFDGIVENGEVIGNIHENAELLEEKQ